MTRGAQWHIKATAMIASSFQHVLYLDSDNMPAFAPDDSKDGVLFAPGYQRTGAMFWPDYWCVRPSIWRSVALTLAQEVGRSVAGLADHRRAVQRCVVCHFASLAVSE